MRYPVLLVHGVACRDNRYINYWGRIPKQLRQAGISVFFGNQDGYGSVEDNAAFLKNRVEEVLQETGAEKVNIIAHSKGGLDCRYMIGKLGMGDRVASLTTLCSPHHGSRTMDAILRLPGWMIRTASFFCNIWYRFMEDKHPNAYKVFQQFSTSFAREFNRTIPEDERVYCQSYAFLMKRATSDFIMWLPYLVVKKVEGENDGLVTPRSAMWANFRGVYTSGVNRGISHMDVVDVRRSPFTRKKEAAVGDILCFYDRLTDELAQNGF